MGVYYKKTHKIAGINFLPRLTLAEYNNLTVKPEHWIRTDSPFDYSKTDVPKLTLAQYEDLAIKPKFWIRTDAPQSYTNMSATQVDMTDSVSVYDYLTDLNANQVEYSNGVSVKDKIDALNEKTIADFVGGIAYTGGNPITNVRTFVQNTLSNKQGVFTAYARATDAPNDYVALIIVVKPSLTANYTKVYFFEAGIWFTNLMDTSTSLTWTKLTD